MAIASKRFLNIQKVYNLRDLGGYLAADGKTVKWGQAFRAGDLHLLDDAGRLFLSEIPLKTIIDFRSQAEAQAAPDPLIDSVNKKISLPVSDGDLDVLKAVETRPGQDLLKEANRLMARDCQETFGRFLAVAAEDDSPPLIFHCSAGKDRTGFAAMLFLAALGVSYSTIIADYLLSNEGLTGKYEDMAKQNPRLEPLILADASYLEAGVEVIDQQYGGLDRYLTDVLKADLPRLRSLYTQ